MARGRNAAMAADRLGESSAAGGALAARANLGGSGRMSWLWAVVGGAALASAFAAIMLGRNLTRSVTAGYVFIAFAVLACAMAGVGFLGWIVAIGATLTLASVQVFGWMLVDVDRDHLPPTERATLLARGLAFALLAAGLALLVYFAAGELADSDPPRTALQASEVGAALFGRLREETILLGFSIAAALLATLLLLRDDGGEG
jgi:hypothetical protein